MENAKASIIGEVLEVRLVLWHWTTCDSCGSRDKCFFSVIRDHLNNVIIKEKGCFVQDIYNKLLLQNKTKKYVKQQPNHNTFKYLLHSKQRDVK